MQARGLLGVVGQTALETLLCARMGQLLMRLKRFVEPGFVDLESALGREFLRQFNWETKRIIQMERADAVDDAAF